MKPMADTHTNSATLALTGQLEALAQKPPALPPLPEADLRRAQALAASLAVPEERLGDLISLGTGTQAALAEVTKAMLAGVRVNALDEVLQLSDGVLAQVRLVRLEDLSPAARRWLFWLVEPAAFIRRRVAKFFRGYTLVSRQLDRQEASIFAKEAEATQRYHADARLEQAARQVMLDARIGVAAIELFLSGPQGWPELDRRQRAAADERAAAARDNRAVDMTVVTAAERYAKYLERVEMKRTSLQRASLSAYQGSLTLRMLEDNENVIRQKLSDIRTDLLPQWRMLITIAYNAYVQQGVGGFVRSLERMEADLRRQTADQVEQAAATMADLVTRPVFDPAALKYQQDKLVGALETLRAASAEARQIRAAAEATLQRSMAELSEAAAGLAAPHQSGGHTASGADWTNTYNSRP